MISYRAAISESLLLFFCYALQLLLLLEKKIVCGGGKKLYLCVAALGGLQGRAVSLSKKGNVILVEVFIHAGPQ